MDSQMEIIAGVDEAGRGPLAGPVVAAAVILPLDHDLTGLNDSKKLTPRKREELFNPIREQALAVGVGCVDVADIDQINILKATFKAMQMALGRLSVRPDCALVDGMPLPNQIIPNIGVKKGDSIIDSIMAASIIAKVTRDRIMGDYDIIFPEYGFARHKGYGTRDHILNLQTLKATPIHRRTFRPVNQNLPTLSWLRKNRRVGWWGERLAALYLMDRGYRILEMNRHCRPYGEIDLVTETGEGLVFVEVKTFSKEQMGRPELKVDMQKMKRLDRSVRRYLQEHEYGKTIRLDAMTVELGKGRPRFQHFKNITLD